MIIALLKFVFLKNFLNFQGRASRKEFWYAFLFNFIVTALISVIFRNSTVGTILLGVWSLAVLLPFLGVTARRLHDINKSGWLILVALIPLIGEIILIIWLARQGDATENQYGPVPQDNFE